MSGALDLAELDAGWPAAEPPVEPAPARDTAPPDPPSGVRARPPAKPPLPIAVVARRYMKARRGARGAREGQAMIGAIVFYVFLLFMLKVGLGGDIGGR